MPTGYCSSTAALLARHVAEIVQTRGLAAVFAGMAEAIRYDFLRWEEFDKILYGWI